VQYCKLPYEEVKVGSQVSNDSFIYFKVTELHSPYQLTDIKNLIYVCLHGMPISKKNLEDMNIMWSKLTADAGLQKLPAERESNTE
jgi:hypothetical protein